MAGHIFNESDIMFQSMTVATVRFSLRQTAVMDRKTKKLSSCRSNKHRGIFIGEEKKI
jgi:hypothetical protein